MTSCALSLSPHPILLSHAVQLPCSLTLYTNEISTERRDGRHNLDAPRPELGNADRPPSPLPPRHAYVGKYVVTYKREPRHTFSYGILTRSVDRSIADYVTLSGSYQGRWEFQKRGVHRYKCVCTQACSPLGKGTIRLRRFGGLFHSWYL